MKILSFPASNSRHSINRQLLNYAERFLTEFDIEHLDINDYEMPIYSEDREKESGIPDKAKAFLSKIAEADALLISFAEHNGNYAAAFKNLFDRCSRANREIYGNKNIAMLSTSVGSGGASNVLALAEQSEQFFAGKVVAKMSVPSFHDNFDVEQGQLNNSELASSLEEVIAQFKASLGA